MYKVKVGGDTQMCPFDVLHVHGNLKAHLFVSGYPKDENGSSNFSSYCCIVNIFNYASPLIS